MGAQTMIRPLFGKILIANRGEIACRITSTCRRLGVRTVAVYSDVDATSLHVRLADEAVHIGGSSPAESYLKIEAILNAAKRTGAQAIHPGYGFLSENEAFAEACTQAGIVFIGPPPSAIHAMGSKSMAKALMQQAGVPLTPGYHGENQSPEHLSHEADQIGYPVLIKASAGGGGKGMRRVDEPAAFLAALASCKREAAASFGDEKVLIEQYILTPRHIEIQIFADQQGNVVSLFERDCSVQRRHQKVLEEAPAPGIHSELRAAMSKAACDAARAVNYVGAGTVEFIVDPSDHFHFMEMNTRLQVEHPVTECITGLDLVEWQLRIAAGEPLPLRQDQIALHGHAIEARIYAEDPDNGFLPSVGQLVYLQTPQLSPHVRIDSGVEQGDTITPFYDPIIAKLIVWDDTRELALDRMKRALRDVQIVGVANNIGFLGRIVTSSSFTTAALDTALIEREEEWLHASPSEPPSEACLLVTLRGLQAEEQIPQAESSSPWSRHDGWRLAGSLKRRMVFVRNEMKRPVDVEYLGDSYRMTLEGRSFIVIPQDDSGHQLSATINGQRLRATVVESQRSYYVFLDGQRHVYQLVDPLASNAEAEVQESDLGAPMPGRIVTLLVAPGDQVKKGDPLLVLEAMKMEYTVKAPADGTLQSFLFAVGDQVAEGEHLLLFDRDKVLPA
jgi:3-methylcrotonyl-CoA carboxylase alpha subunit